MTHYTRIVGLTLTFHLAANLCFGMLLPKERTGLFLVPLITLMSGSLIALPRRSFWVGLGQSLLATILGVCVVYFGFCFRLGYFREWRYEADVDRVFRLVSCYARMGLARQVTTDYRYDPPLRYYLRVQAPGLFEIERVGVEDHFPRGEKIYVLGSRPTDVQVVRDRGLLVVYKGPISDAVVAVPPHLQTPACRAQ